MRFRPLFFSKNRWSKILFSNPFPKKTLRLWISKIRISILSEESTLSVDFMDSWSVFGYASLDDIFEPPGQNELIILKTDSRFFFSLASPALRIRACEAQALALTLLWPNSKQILEKKTDCFAVYLETGHVNLSRHNLRSGVIFFFCFFASLAREGKK